MSDFVVGNNLTITNSILKEVSGRVTRGARINLLDCYFGDNKLYDNVKIDIDEGATIYYRNIDFHDFPLLQNGEILPSKMMDMRSGRSSHVFSIASYDQVTCSIFSVFQ